MGGKDDEKFVKPLFPRVHVRDTEKGWPRAPPRNKMALYEHLTVSSQKFEHGYFYPANGNANNLQSAIQQVPPAAPVRVARECNGRLPDTASVLSSSSRHVLRKEGGDDDDYMVPVLGNSNADMVGRESNVETDAVYRDGETGMNSERSKESIIFDNDDKDGDDDGNGAVVSDTRDISVDDVVGTIGQKCFWKAKNAIFDQQRLFAKQVFELHRLIKVQRLIAESPHLLFNDSTSLRKPSPKQKHLAPGFLIKPLPRYASFKNDNHQANHNDIIEGSAENSPGRSQSIAQSPSDSPQQPANASPAMPATTKPMCCLQQPPGHHWLVPVMSSSEGLIYKPYLSLPGFTSGCRGCCHLNNFASMAFGFPAFPQQQGICSLQVAHPMLGHFPPFGLPVPDPGTFPAQHMDQIMHPYPPSSLVHPSNLTRTETTNIFQDQGSCNLPTRATATSLEVSTADTSSFPLNPIDLDETKVVRPGRVIRAVPRNPRLATESGARIFCSIQEERRQV